MKRFLLLLAVLGAVSIVDVQAQGCAKSTAAKAAALDASIVQKVNHTTGETDYFKKSVSPHTGKVSYTEVEYCTRTGQFVSADSGKSRCVKSTAACSKYYGGSSASLLVSTVPAHCTAAQKAACIQATQKAEVAKATFVANTGRAVKP
ncbi:MAG: hypothetical protein SFU99_14935 [Saprospiraceae bacterium]|nr:hypothetical protein [Saprospiraceae bacterium]